MTRLNVQLFGTFFVTIEGEPANQFESDKVRALLAYLLVEADFPHRRDALACMLWPEMCDQNARMNLRRALYNLRLGIGERESGITYLEADRQNIRFKSQSDYSTDTLLFDEFFARGGADIACFASAAGLYRGKFLQGFSISGGIEFDEWLLIKQEQYALKMCVALRTLSLHYENQGNYPRAIDYSRRLASIAPLSEPEQRLLIRQLAAYGHRQEALSQYERVCHLLGDELGVKPDVDTELLIQAIKQGSVRF